MGHGLLCARHRDMGADIWLYRGNCWHFRCWVQKAFSVEDRVAGWAGRRQVPRMASSTEKHANLNTQVPLVVSHSWALFSV